MGFALRLRKQPRPEIERRVHDAAALLGLENLLDRTPRQLSGGQRQRVAIGRALVREPQVFLFDEPLSNLDAKLRGEMRREIAALHRRLGTTMIYVTHDQLEAMTLGDRIVVMNQGRVEQIGTPAEVYDHPRDTFVAGFLGNPPMNLLPGTLAADHGTPVFRADAASDLAIPVSPTLVPATERPPARVILGVRPEHVHIRSTAAAPDHFNASEADAAAAPLLPATVELVEPLGHEQLVHLRLGAAPIIARTTGRFAPRGGTMTHITFEPDRLRLFDADTTLALGVQPGA
jgi:multiple sugar transport system ATP-binding protein